jgi:hypothetical protein
MYWFIGRLLSLRRPGPMPVRFAHYTNGMALDRHLGGETRRIPIWPEASTTVHRVLVVASAG